MLWDRGHGVESLKLVIYFEQVVMYVQYLDQKRENLWTESSIMYRPLTHPLRNKRDHLYQMLYTHQSSRH